VLDDVKARISVNWAKSEPRNLLDFYLLPAHTFDEKPHKALTADWPPVGTGPMAASLEGGAILFERFDNPHHQGRIKSMVMFSSGSPDEVLDQLLNGEIHGAIHHAKPPPGIRPNRFFSTEQWYVALNTKSSLLADSAVRRALDLTIDRDVLRAAILKHDIEGPNPPLRVN
jgi:ABC-type transport system substrate-binding protein